MFFAMIGFYKLVFNKGKIHKNFYFDVHDYEIELEVQEAEDGKVNFFDFLQENNLPYTPLKSKIARFAKNLPNS